MSGNMQEMCPAHQISCVQEMCMKCHLSYFHIFSFTVCQKVPTRNVKEMCLKCHVYWLQEMCPKFHVSWFRKCTGKSSLYCTRKSQGNVKISWCRKCTRNVNFLAHFMGFPCSGNLGFLPVETFFMYTVEFGGNL